MNKSQLLKSVGVRVQLRPPAVDRDGRVWDGDWLIESVEDERVQLRMIGFGYSVPLGTDHVYSFLTNPARDNGGLRFGFLQLHVQLMISGNTVHIEPLPPPKTPTADAAAYARRFSPLTIEHEGRTRYFTWHGQDPLHLVEKEDEPRQLGRVAAPLCEALHQIPGLHPRFNLASRIRGEIVYELSPDFRTKWKLLGGRSDGTGDQVLVLVPNP